MSARSIPSRLPTTSSRLAHLGNMANLLALLGLCGALSLAFGYQLALGELPCPMCLLQRAGMILMGLGFLMNIRFGIRSAHYGAELAGAVTTGIIGMRQVFLNIAPDAPGFGSAFLGLHFYTWSVLASLAIIVGVAGLLGLKSCMPATLPAWSSRWAKALCALFVLLIAANLVSTLLECGVGKCDSDPTYYKLLGK